MKKILLSITLAMGLGATGYSQLALNEIYSEPGCGTIGTTASDWFELYNGTGNDINLDCYRFVTVYQSPTNEGSNTYAYVFDLPNRVITANGFFVFSGLNTFCYQGGPTHTLGANGYNWNSMTAGTDDASLTRYILNNGAWVIDQEYVDGNDLFKLLAISSQTSAKYHFFLFNANTVPPGGNDIVENALLFGYNLTTPPPFITTLPNLSQGTLTAGACNSNGTMSFASITSNEQVTAASGSDNGYNREFNGICGTWLKGGPSTKYSPGATNNTELPPPGSGLFSLGLGPVACAGNTGTYVAPIGVDYAGSSPYTLEYYVIIDNAPFTNPMDPVRGVEDVQVAEGTYDGVDGIDTFYVNGLLSQRSYFITAVNAAGCYSATIYVPGPACSILPVEFASFSATRNRTMVNLKWETSFEQENSGFAIERNVGGVWTEIAFVPSLATDGNSSDMLAYTYADPNNIKGITQYRLRQVDFDGRSKFSAIRAVRGEGQLANTVVYPNPTSDGKVTVVFEDGNSHRDVSLIDMSGRVIRQWKGVTNNNIQIDNLNPGVFSLRIVIPATGEQAVEKIVVNKR